MEGPRFAGEVSLCRGPPMVNAPAAPAFPAVKGSGKISSPPAFSCWSSSRSQAVREHLPEKRSSRGALGHL